MRFYGLTVLSGVDFWQRILDRDEPNDGVISPPSVAFRGLAELIAVGRTPDPLRYDPRAIY